MRFDVEEVSADGWTEQIWPVPHSKHGDIRHFDALFGKIKASIMSLPVTGGYAWSVNALNWSADGKEWDLDEAKRKAEAIALALPE